VLSWISWILDCDCSQAVINVKVPGESLATWRTSQLVWEIDSQNQIESIPDQNSWPKLLLKSGKISQLSKRSESGNRLSKELLLETTSQKKYFFWEPISRLYFFREPIRIFDSTSPKKSAFKKAEGGKNDSAKNMNSQEKNLNPTFARKLSLACDLCSIKCDPAKAFSCVGEGMLLCLSATWI